MVHSFNIYIFRIAKSLDVFVVVFSLFFFSLSFFFERWGREREAKRGNGVKDGCL